MDLRFAPAWGGVEKVQPDAFVIGKVKTSPDLRKVTVSLGAFDRDAMFDILDFDVRTDRYMLADVGQGYSLSRSRRVRGVSDDAIFLTLEDDGALTNSATSTSSSDSSSSSSSLSGFPVELTVYYDNQPQVMSDDVEASGTLNKSLPEPQPSQKLTFGLKNVTDKTLGVVLLVNGYNTLYQQYLGDPADMNKWVLEPGTDYRVKGYHQEGNEKYFEITTLTEEESIEQFEDLGGEEAAGLIHLYVFKTVDPTLAEVPQYTRSIGGIARGRPRRFGTLSQFQQAIARRSDLFPPGVRPLAGWGQEKTETLQEKNLGTVSQTEVLIVRYSKTKP
jgi:hypothetical protein